MKLHCPDCQTLVPARHVNLERCLASCPECHSIFDFGSLVGGGGGEEGEKEEEEKKKRTTASRRRVDLPSNVDVVDGGKTLEVRIRWRHWKYYPLAFFCLLWDGFMIGWFTMAFTSGALVMAAFGSLHAAVGVALTYYVVCGFVNRTVILVGDERISIRHEPLPWPGQMSLELGLIDQLFCEEKVHRSKNGRSYTYELHACLHDGNRMSLISGLNRPEEAFFLEQEMERFLGIEDRRVEGEFGK